MCVETSVLVFPSSVSLLWLLYNVVKLALSSS